jgi:hypothetical protein
MTGFFLQQLLLHAFPMNYCSLDYKSSEGIVNVNPIQQQRLCDNTVTFSNYLTLF